MNGLNAQRYNPATRIRRNCASILGVRKSDLVQPDIRRAKFREEIGQVSETGTFLSVDVLILHKDWNGEYSLPPSFSIQSLWGEPFILNT